MGVQFSPSLKNKYIYLLFMGALTSKPYSFKVRPWEIQKYFSVDFFDILGLPILVDLIGNKLLRIENNSNIYWITDKIRFFYDSFYNYRLKNPFINIFFLKKKINLLFSVNWLDIYDYFFSLKSLLFFVLEKININFYNFLLKKNYNNNFFYFFKYKSLNLFYINDDFDLIQSNSLLFLKKIINFNIFNNFINKQINYDFLNNLFLINIENYKIIFLLNCNLRLEIPSLYYYFLKKKNNNILKIYNLGYNINYNSFFINLGFNSINFLYSKIKQIFKYKFFNIINKETLVIFGLSFLQKYDFNSIYNLYKKFFNILKINNFFFINYNLSFYSLFFSDFFLSFKDFSLKKKYDISFFFNENIYENYNMTLIKSSNYFFLGHHLPEKLLNFDLLLPIDFIFERKNVFINSFNTLNYSDFLITPEYKNIRNFNDVLFIFFLSFYNKKYIYIILNLFFSKLNFLCIYFLYFYKNMKISLYIYIYIFFLYLKINYLKNLNFLNNLFLNKSNLFYKIKIKMQQKIFLFYKYNTNNFIYNYFCFDLSTKYSLNLILKSKLLLIKNNYNYF